MAKRIIKPATDQEVDRLYAEVMNCSPALAPAELDLTARYVCDQQQFGIPYQTGLVLATKDGEFFKQMAADREMAELFSTVVNPVLNCADAMRHLADLLTAGATRVTVALCNHDRLPLTPRPLPARAKRNSRTAPSKHAT